MLECLLTIFLGFVSVLLFCAFCGRRRWVFWYVSLLVDHAADFFNRWISCLNECLCLTHNYDYVSMWSVYLSIDRRLLFKYLKKHDACSSMHESSTDSWLVWTSKQINLNVIIVIHHLKYILSRVDKEVTAILIIYSMTGSLFTLFEI